MVLLVLLVGCSQPVDMKKAVCVAGDTFEYHYSGDKVYEFYVNGEEQDGSMVDIVQDAVNDYESAEDYFDFAFQHGVCTYTEIS